MSNKPKVIRKTIRDWLNPITQLEDSGHIRLSTDYVVNDEKRQDFYSCLDIADCSRKISLSFDIFDTEKNGIDKQYVARKKKIKVLRKHLDVLEKELDNYHEYRKSL